jgi:hypothetical protein
MMEGSEVGTMDGTTQIRWTLGSSQNTQCVGMNRMVAGAGGQAETLRDKLIAATVEIVAMGSNPRLAGSAHTQIAP